MRSQETAEKREVRYFIFFAFALVFISGQYVKIFRRAWKLPESDSDSVLKQTGKGIVWLETVREMHCHYSMR